MDVKRFGSSVCFGRVPAASCDPSRIGYRVSALDECLQHDATHRAQRLSRAALDRVSAWDECLQHHATHRAQRLSSAALDRVSALDEPAASFDSSRTRLSSAVLDRVSALDECLQHHTIFLPFLTDNYDACFCVVFHPYCIRICMRARVIVL